MATKPILEYLGVADEWRDGRLGDDPLAADRGRVDLRDADEEVGRVGALRQEGTPDDPLVEPEH